MAKSAKQVRDEIVAKLDKQDRRIERLYVDTADVAKLIRARLREEFPGVKFSVRIDRYSGGSSIRARWTDGPTRSEVQALLDTYQGKRFDGMIDLQYGAENYLEEDGSSTVARTFGHSYEDVGGTMVESRKTPGAVLVSWGASYVFAERELSDEFRAKVIERIEAETGQEFDPHRNYREGYPAVWGSDLVWRYAEGVGGETPVRP